MTPHQRARVEAILRDVAAVSTATGKRPNVVALAVIIDETRRLIRAVEDAS
jgi:hypothetical protein